MGAANRGSFTVAVLVWQLLSGGAELITQRANAEEHEHEAA